VRHNAQEYPILKPNIRNLLERGITLRLSMAHFLPERGYVTFGYLLSQIRLSLVVCLSVTFVHTQGVETFSIISLNPLTSMQNFYKDRPRGTAPSEALNTRQVAK